MNQVEDFSEYQGFFEKNDIDLEEFVQHLNVVCEYKKCNYIHDYTKIIMELHKIGETQFIKQITDRKTFSNFKVLCLYFKFLILEPEQKDKFFNQYIENMEGGLLYLKYRVSPTTYEGLGDFEMWSLNKIMQEIYRYMNDNFLEKFMDCLDSKDEYEPLHIQDIQNIEYDRQKYLNEYFYFNFHIFVMTYQSIQFIYNLNYCLSNTPMYQSMEEYDGQILSGMQDFCKRFEACIDKYIIFFHYIYFQYNRNKRFHIYISDMCTEEVDSYVEFILNISSDKILSVRGQGLLKEATKEIKEDSIRKLLNGLLQHSHVVENDHHIKELTIYLDKVIEYNKYYPSDEYKLNQLVKYDPFETSKKLKSLHDSFFSSDTYKSLLYLLNNVYHKLHITESLSKEETELKNYLAEIFDKLFHFSQLFHCKTELDKIKLR